MRHVLSGEYRRPAHFAGMRAFLRKAAVGILTGYRQLVQARRLGQASAPSSLTLDLMATGRSQGRASCTWTIRPSRGMTMTAGL